MRHLRRAVVAAAALILTLPPPATADVRAERLEPDRLPRGADVSVPHVEASTIVDGGRRITVDADELTLLATGKVGYVVRAVGGTAREGRRILLVRRDGRQRRVQRGAVVFESVVSDDGRFLAFGQLLSDGVTEVVVRRTTDGRRVASHVFGGPGGAASVVDVTGDRILLGRSRSGRTELWSFRSDTVRVVAEKHRWTYAGDLQVGLLAAFTTGAERCSVVVPIARPGRVLWKSCEERVLVFSPDGRRVATTRKRVLPGLDPVTAVWVRTSRGRLLGHHVAESFDDVRWEGGRRLLLDTEGRRSTSIVRCVAATCRNATDPLPLP